MLTLLNRASTMAQPEVADAWEAEYAIFQTIDAEYSRRCAAFDAASEAWDAACPRDDALFDVYDLRVGMDREQALRTATFAIIRQDFTGVPLYPPEQRAAYKAALAAATQKAEQIADQWVTYMEQHYSTRDACRVEECGRAVDEYQQTWSDARDRILAVPAPDHAALLIKLELAHVSLDDEHLDSALADARRLLGGAQ